MAYRHLAISRSYWLAVGLAALVAPAAWGAEPVNFWSYRPVVRPAIPADVGPAGSPVDAFVRHALREKGLAISPPADRRTLIRRVTFDLTGLPPTPTEIDAFVKDADPRAYEHLVDRLLASPGYGERWARHWLDVVRFAESQGFEENQPRANAWPYRDYVIRAFNDDEPFDRFVTEQLAGDAGGVDDATGYLVAGPTDDVKSPDPVLTAQQRADELNDMVSTAGTAFLASTVGCARCHDHKFDPIVSRDYYRMTAVFAGVVHGSRPMRRLAGPASAQADRLRERIAEIERKIAAAQSASPGDSAVASGLRPAVRPDRNVEHFKPVVAQSVRFTVLATAAGDEPGIDEMEVLAVPGPGQTARNVALATLGSVATASGTIPGFAIHKVEHVNDGQWGNEHSWISDRRGEGWIEIRLAQPAEIDAVTWGRDRNGTYTDRLATRYRIEVTDAAGEKRTVASSDDRRPYGGANPVTAEVRSLNEEKSSLQSQLRSYETVYGGTFTQPRETFRLNRGDPMQKLEPVSPGGIAAVAPAFDLPADAPEQKRRLGLAAWITDPANPLTARVIVNRLWQHHFGRGIVATPSDFGHMGARPTHPELLDFLASELVNGGWRLKPIQRLIVLSEAYRQSSRPDAAAAALDAQDALLWRFPPQRLDAEQIRDSILAVSGKLDLSAGGPGFDAFEPNGNYVHIYQPKEDFGPAEWRRMIYETRPRLQTDGVFGAFDCPDGAQVTPRRTVSTTPLQALNLLHSKFVVRQSEFLADRLRREAGDDPAAQVRLAFALAFGRAPDDAETQAAVALVRAAGLPDFCRAIYNANEFLYVD